MEKKYYLMYSDASSMELLNPYQDIMMGYGGFKMQHHKFHVIYY